MTAKKGDEQSGEPVGPRRSASWFGLQSRTGLIHRAWLRNQGIPAHLLDGRPVIGICNTASELTPCNAHLRDLAEHVRRGVYEAGGFPLEFPVMSLGETMMRPTTMLYRNLASMEVEEVIRANPLDGVVLMCGCDKTTPALVMGAASCDVPAIVVSGGPMLNGKYEGRDIGSGTSLWAMADEVRAGTRTMESMLSAEAGISRSAGSCMSMGTASSMAAVMEVMGLALPYNGTIPAVDSRRRMLAYESGIAAVRLVEQDVRLSRFLTRASFANAVTVNAALGGSTNVAVHLLAIAGRIGVPLTLEDIDRWSRDIPLLVDIMPGGKRLMEDFHYAGGIPAVIAALGERIDRSVPTVSGRPLGDAAAEASCHDATMITPLTTPVKPAGGIAVLRGNLAPDGAVVKLSAASPALLRHCGPALVFDGVPDLQARIDEPDLDVTADTILVLRGAGPRGYPGMPEAGSLPIPAKLLRAGVTDMVRISDARMSGTSGGTAILHVAPEAAVGGPLALVRDGDRIEIDIAARRIHLDVTEAELARRRALWSAPAEPASGYVRLYTAHVQQADRGADFDFLVGCRGHAVPPAH